jgi:three-Cys-motif partner protein
VRVKGTKEVLDGSPLVAWKTAVEAGAPFSSVSVADANADLCSASATRLASLNAPVKAYVGEALAIADSVIAALNPYALHLAFLDPYSLEGLPFALVQKLAKLERMDILMHISVQDLNRNLRKYIDMPSSPLDQFAPAWRSMVDIARDDKLVRGKIFEHWRGLLKTIGMQTAEAAELVSADGNQPLYWLAFVARHSRALEFWEKVRDLKGQGTLHAT